jgi:hypothetical protein
VVATSTPRPRATVKPTANAMATHVRFVNSERGRFQSFHPPRRVEREVERDQNDGS